MTDDDAGREKEARQLAGEVLASAGARDLAAARACAHRALGLLELAAGRSEEALEHFRPLFDAQSSVHPGVALQNAPEYIEAMAQLHQPDRAAEPLARLTQWAEATKAPELLALVARCRALVGSQDSEHEFRTAVVLHSDADRPMEQARTELLFGEHLRRERRRADARPHLRAALETFQRLGVPVWADRARNELRATGESIGSPAPDALALLTPQELRIATVVGEGATNREVAAQLFLSPARSTTTCARSSRSSASARAPTSSDLWPPMPTTATPASPSVVSDMSSVRLRHRPRPGGGSNGSRRSRGRRRQPDEPSGGAVPAPRWGAALSSLDRGAVKQR